MSIETLEWLPAQGQKATLAVYLPRRFVPAFVDGREEQQGTNFRTWGVADAAERRTKPVQLESY